jgi:hypothetical protein
MRKNISIFVAACLLLVVVSAGVFGQRKSMRRSATRVPPVVCRDGDEDCFIRAAETCRKAGLTVTGSLDLLGIFTTTGTSYREIRGRQNGDYCAIYFKTGKTDVKFTEEFVRKMKERGVTDEQIEQKELEANRTADLAEGSDGICTFKRAKLVALLRKWKSGSFSSEDWKGGDCRGTMFDQIAPVREP